MSCPYINASAEPLPLDNYAYLHRDGKRLIAQWFRRAKQPGRFASKSPFEAFIFLWISFNGFASCVTEEDRDAEMMRRLGTCPEMRGRFDRLLRSDKDFSSSVREFASLWPIFKVMDIRKTDRAWSGLSTRPELVRYYLEEPRIRYEPNCFPFHRNQGEDIPLDWPHTIHTIYRVRCNLFHGDKSPQSEMDQLIVNMSFHVLAKFLERSGLIET